MVKSVIRQYRWTPETVDKLYIDAHDHHGIEFLYNDIKASIEELKAQNKK